MNKNNILFFDDLIPAFLQEQVEAVIPHLPLRFGHRGLGYDQGYRTFSEQWTRNIQHGVSASHTNFLADMPWELKAMWTVLHHARTTLFKNVEDLQLNQCQINLTTEEHFGGKHTDAPDDSELIENDPNWLPSHTMVYFVQGDTGMQFWNKDGEVFHTVDFKKGRCVVFPSSFIHEGIQPKEVSPRVTIGFIFNGLSLQS